VIEHRREWEQSTFEGIALNLHYELDQFVHIRDTTPVEIREHLPE
jgi:hypothetical protein